MIICLGVLLQIIQIFISFLQRNKNLDTTGDPWNGRTLEWSTPSPPPFYNFATIPIVEDRDAFWQMKQRRHVREKSYEDIHLPKNTASGIFLSLFIFLLGFGLIWQIYWLVFLGFIGSLIVLIQRTFDEETEYTLTAAELAKLEKNG
jgi:cytochrome o ubiquinol oxidase subunit 1